MPTVEDLGQIPGYLDVVAHERELREAPFAGLPEFIGRVEVKALTFVHVMRLSAAKSKYLCGGLPTPNDTALFLWAVSPEYETALRIQAAIAPWSNRLARRVLTWMRNKFYRQLRGSNWDELMSLCAAYIDESFMDAPGSVKREGFMPSYFSAAASRVAVLGEIFGWTPETIMNLPIKAAYQIENVLKKNNNPKAILFNPSDKVRSAFLREQTENGDRN